MAYFSWVITGFLNPVHAALPMNMIVWFLVPAIIHLVCVKKEIKQN